MTDDPHSQAAWDARYASRDQVWSGSPNAQLVAEAEGLGPARALDVGSGEGADALWLAQRGWRVTAVDISPVALARGAARAAEHGPEVAGWIAWEHVDVRTWTPPRGAFDLVSAQFLHPTPELRADVVGRLGSAVVPGGVLLYVGHDPSDHAAGHGHPELLVSAAEVAALLESGEWKVEVAETRPRRGALPGRPATTLHDAVVLARRLHHDSRGR